MTDIALAHDTSILIIDDEPMCRDIIRHMLDGDDILLLEAESIETAWQMLSENFLLQIDLILLDRKLPDGDGLDLIPRLRTLPSLQGVPIIIQSGLSSPEDIEAGMKQGAYHYLEKPYQRDMLRTLIRIAVKEWREHRYLTARATELGAGSLFLEHAEFRIRTLEDVRHVTPFIAQFFPRPDSAVIGLSELLINAVEHGNLDIDYRKKGELLETNSWASEIQRRQALPQYRTRTVHILLERQESRIQATITDEGSGFTWQEFDTLDESRMFDLHGRGILLARMNCFDGVTFHEKGNVVRCWSNVD